MIQQAERIIAPATRPWMTYEEFLEWADDGQWVEWVDGEIIYLMSASTQHQLVAGFLFIVLKLWAEFYGLGEIFQPPFQMKTGPDLPGREPDLLFVKKARTRLLKKNFLDGPADLVIEIISPDSRQRDRMTKFAEYEKGGVEEYWLLDPEKRTAEFFRLDEDGVYHSIPLTGGVFHSDVLDGCWIQTDWLWQDPLPNALWVLQEWGLINR